MSATIATAPLTTATSTCATGLSGAFNSTNPACAIDASPASVQALDHCCGGGPVLKQQNDCILLCEPQGITLNAVNQCLFLYLGQHAPGYQGGIHCNRDGAEFSISQAPGVAATASPSAAATTNGTSTSSGNTSRQVGWTGLVVTWVTLCAIGTGLGSMV